LPETSIALAIQCLQPPSHLAFHLPRYNSPDGPLSLVGATAADAIDVDATSSTISSSSFDAVAGEKVREREERESRR